MHATSNADTQCSCSTALRVQFIESYEWKALDHATGKLNNTNNGNDLIILQKRSTGIYVGGNLSMTGCSWELQSMILIFKKCVTPRFRSTQQNSCIFFSDVRSRPLTFEAAMLKRETLVMRFLLELSLELY